VCLLDERDEYDESPAPSRAITVPGIDNAQQLEVPLAVLADGSVVRFHIDEHKKWSVTPLPALAGIRDISSGGYGWSATCGLKDNRAVCWLDFGGGKDSMGLLARSSKVQSGIPAPVEGLGDVSSVTAGNSHVCAVDTSDALWCWGDDRYGELGRGRFTLRDEPKRITF
jgi:hypothetical protein